MWDRELEIEIVLSISLFSVFHVGNMLRGILLLNNREKEIYIYLGTGFNPKRECSPRNIKEGVTAVTNNILIVLWSYINEFIRHQHLHKYF